MKQAIQIKHDPKSHKVGANEVIGLKDAMAAAFTPVRDLLRSKAYWDQELEFQDAEYKSRDGFIPHSHNCGGLQLDLHVPECESYEWDFLEFGELTEEYTRDVEPYENEGELDAFIRIWFKFEGVSDSGELEFYLVMSGGNDDAPYFRSIPTLFEASFTCKSVAGVRRAAAKHVKALLKVMGA